MLHTRQGNDVTPILPPAVGWVAAATLVVMFTKDSWHVVCVSCLVALKCGYLIGFDILVLIMLYERLALCGVFISGSYESPVLSNTGGK